MRILLTTHQFFPDFAAGTEVLTRSVARELMARGHEVRVMTGFPAIQALLEEDRFDEYEFEGIHVYRFHHAYIPMAGQTTMVELSFDNHLAANHFNKILVGFKPDVVHFFHLNRLGTGLIELATQAGIPAFMTATDFWVVCPTAQLLLENGKPCSGPSRDAGNCVKHLAQGSQKGVGGVLVKYVPTPWVDSLVRLTQAGLLPPYRHQAEVRATAARLSGNVARLNQLKKLLAPNRFMRELLIRHGVAQHRIVQSAFGIDRAVNPIGTVRHPPRQPFRIGYIGTLASYKGCHVLIEAFKRLPAGRAILKIYGKQDDFPDYARQLKQAAGRQQSIEFCGVFPNSCIAEVLADLDVLVVPSLWYENTPLVLYSAQAARCPVLASDFPGISEVIADEVNGLLFQAGKVAALTKQLLRLIEEPGLAERLSAHARPPKSTVRYVDELLEIWQSS